MDIQLRLPVGSSIQLSVPGLLLVSGNLLHIRASISPMLEAYLFSFPTRQSPEVSKCGIGAKGNSAKRSQASLGGLGRTTLMDT